jgi:hypothetical protein
MTIRLTTAAAVTALIALSGTASAQGTPWSYEATIYLFGAESTVGLDTPDRNLESTLSFADALENLDFAFMGTFVARNGPWSLMADYNYTDLGFSNATPGSAFSGLDTAAKTQFLSGYVGYRVHDTPTAHIDLAGGFRWFSSDTTLTLTPGTQLGQSFTADQSWTDPVIAAKAGVTFSDRWSGTAFADYGGFTDDSETWQVLFSFDYALNDRWLLRGGYRYISFENETDAGDTFSFSQSGPVFGATFRF